MEDFVNNDGRTNDLQLQNIQHEGMEHVHLYID